MNAPSQAGTISREGHGLMKTINVLYRIQGDRSENCCRVEAGTTIGDLKEVIRKEQVDKQSQNIDVITGGAGIMFIQDGEQLDETGLVTDLPSDKPVHLSNLETVIIKARWQNNEVEIATNPATTVGKIKKEAIALIGLDMDEHSEDDLLLRDTAETLSNNVHVGSVISGGVGVDTIEVDLVENDKRQG